MTKSIACMSKIAVLLLCLSWQCKADKTIDIAIIDWCPFICPKTPETPGLLVEFVNKAFADSMYTPSYRIYPWSRAIIEVKAGTVTALLAPAKNEAPQLLFPNSVVGYQQFCFYSRESDPWRYTIPESALKRRLVYPRDALPQDLLELSYKAEHWQAESFARTFMQSNSKLLLEGYVDSLLMTSLSMKQFLKSKSWDKGIVESGCVPKTELFLAFSPAQQRRAEVQGMMQQFDTAAQKLSEQGVLSELLVKYGLD